MVTSKSTLEIIRDIIKKHYARLTVSVLGRSELSSEELKVLEEAGYDTSNKDSLLSLVYNHSFINHPPDSGSPTSISDMKSQQSVKGLIPQGAANEYTTDNANDKMKQYILKLRQDVATRIENLIRENNDNFKMDSLQNLDREDFLDSLVKESSVGKLKRALQDTSKDGNRDWLRVAITELSNTVGIAGVDRIVTDNRDSGIEDIYVYRVIVNDAATCKYCKRFYMDSDGSPKLYKLSTLLDNGSNYGKKTDSWKPTTLATHPNERCSAVIELKPGFALTTGGTPTYIGLDKWSDYIHQKVTE